MKELSTMVELTGAELDAVAAGRAIGIGVGGLAGVGVGVEVGDITVDDVVRVDHNTVEINENNVAIGVAAAILGVSANFIRQNT
jgi:hypothetical protein